MSKKCQCLFNNTHNWPLFIFPSKNIFKLKNNSAIYMYTVQKPFLIYMYTHIFNHIFKQLKHSCTFCLYTVCLALYRMMQLLHSSQAESEQRVQGLNPACCYQRHCPNSLIGYQQITGVNSGKYLLIVCCTIAIF